MLVPLSHIKMKMWTQFDLKCGNPQQSPTFAFDHKTNKLDLYHSFNTRINLVQRTPLNLYHSFNPMYNDKIYNDKNYAECEFGSQLVLRDDIP